MILCEQKWSDFTELQFYESMQHDEVALIGFPIR